MKDYCVQVIEVHRQDVSIEAETPEQAIRLVVEGEGENGEIHYSYTLEPDEWKVFEIK